MPSPLDLTQIPSSRIPFIDERTGLMSREWYRFFINLFTLVGGGSNTTSLTDLQVGPPALQVDEVTQIVGTDDYKIAPQPELGTLSAVNIDWVPYLGFDTAPSWIGTSAGQFWFDSSTGAFNAKMGNNNITQQVGEELYRYGKASVAINDSPLQLIYKTGVIGASSVIEFAPAIAGLTDASLILGCATEPIALHGFGRITTYGVIHGITTNGAAYGEVWADNDDIYYNPVTGGLTKTLPTAPNLKMLIGTVINAGSGGSGSFIVKIGDALHLENLSDVQLGALSNGDVLTYDSALQYWKNAPAGAASGATGTTTVDFGSGKTDISVSVSAPSVGALTVVNAWIMPAATATNTIDDHWVENLSVVAGNVQAGVGFTIYAKCENGLAYGTFTVSWYHN